MVNAVYDHIVAILVVGVIFIGAVIVVPSMSLMNLQAINQQQLRNTALNVFNTMLLDTGEPINWGSIRDFKTNDPRVKRFGLASAQESTLYVLDPDKVQRLVKGNPLGEMNYTRVKELLGLQGYGFSLKIIPPFIVKFSSKDINVVGNLLRYNANVSYLDGKPIPNAEVYSTVVYTKGNDYFNISQSGPAKTNEMGVCNGNATLGISNPDYYMVTLRVTVADVATLIVTSGQTFNNTIARINIVYDTIVLTSWKDPPNFNVPPNENVWILDIVAFDSQGLLWYLFEGDKGGQDNKFNSGSGLFERWSQIFHGLHDSDPVILIFNFWAVDPEGHGRSQVLVTMAYPNLLGSSVFEYGGSPSISGSAIKVQRSVGISGMTYTAELWLWKESP